MATPHFNSQHSEVMLDVSAFHSSSQSTPQSKHHQTAKVAQSPIIQAGQSEAHVSESVERVEDSYPESLPMQPPPQPAENDEEDDLYSLSPKGRQCLDATMAKRKAQAQRKQASPPKAKTIDALLDAGATIPSSALNVATSDTESMEKPQSATAMHNDVEPNADSGSVGVTVTTKAGQHAGHKDRKLNDTNLETYQSRRDEGKKDGNGASVSAPNDKAESHGLPVKAGKVAKDVSNDRDGLLRTADAVKTENDETIPAISGRKNQGNNRPNTGGKGLAATVTRATEAAQCQDKSRAKASAKGSRGLPQRQAKQSALEKLKAKHGKTESDLDDMTDDCRDDDSTFAPQRKQAKAATDGNEKAKHLPTPVTAGNFPKKKSEAKSNGKLNQAKQQQTNLAVSARKQPNKPSTQAAPSERVGRPGNPSIQKERAKLSTVARSSQSPPEHRRIGTLAASRNGQHKSEDAPPTRHPGTLKRSERSCSRGRRSRTETSYDFPGTTPNTSKKRRSVSRASKVSTSRGGSARQRMQSELVKERLDRADGNLQGPSVSRQTSPRIAEPKGRLRKPSVSKHKISGSWPPPQTQARDSTTQRESDISQPVRNSYSANLESHELATGSKQAGTKEKLGCSQAHAIMIEQDSQSELSCSPSPRKPAKTRSEATGQVKSRQTHLQRAQTPTMMPSSPPGSDRGSVYTLANHKPTIIAFSRQGPRNQGLSSAKKSPRSAAPSKVLSEYKAAKAGTLGEHAKTIGLPTQLFPPSSQLSYRHPTQETHTAEPGNVAKGDESAFGDFTKDGKNKALAYMLRRSSKVANEPGQEDQGDGFEVMNDFEGTTLIDDHEQPENSPKQPTASQVAMPLPNVVTRGKKDAKTASAHVKLPTKAVAEAVVTKNTPRPAPAQKATNIPKAKGATNSASDEQTSTLWVKDGPERKIAKAMPTDKAAKSKPLMGQTMVQQSQQTRKRGLAESQPGSPARKVKMSQENMFADQEARLSYVQKAPGLTSMQVKGSTDRPDRRKSRLSRRSTQASQGVDILGSPYPKDLEVPKQTTALEVFAQQAGLSSDQTERSHAAPNGRLDLQAISRVVPTTRGELAPTNGLPAPAAPRGCSKAVTRIASGTLAEQLIAVRSVQSSEGNPFTRSRERESSDGQRPAANKFREALKKRGIDLSDRPPVVRSEELGDECFDDVERTLVEPVDEFGQAKQHIASSPGVSEASRASSLDAAAKVLEDVGDWRNSLKPHQSHLFDSLVIAAHTLVRHMVDHETADSTMVADYRRRGEIIVDELQRAHAKEYQQYTKNVHGWKAQAADELATCGRKLKQSMRDADKARAERKKRLLARNGFDYVLEELVAGLD